MTKKTRKVSVPPISRRLEIKALETRTRKNSLRGLPGQERIVLSNHFEWERRLKERRFKSDKRKAKEKKKNRPVIKAEYPNLTSKRPIQQRRSNAPNC